MGRDRDLLICLFSSTGSHLPRCGGTVVWLASPPHFTGRGVEGIEWDGLVSQSVYSVGLAAHLQAMAEETALEQRSRSKMLYINLAGNHLRALKERAGGGRGAAPAPSPERQSAGVDCSRQPEPGRSGAKRGKVAPPQSKKRKIEAVGTTLPLDALMPASGQLTVDGVDKQLLPSSGEGRLTAAAAGSAGGTPPCGKGKAPVAKVQGKPAKRKAAPTGTRSATSSVATVSGSVATVSGSVATVGGSVATVGGSVATVKSSRGLQKCGSDSDSEGWEEHSSWDQTMAVGGRALSSRDSASLTGQKSKAKVGSQAGGRKEGAGQVTPRPHPTGKTNWSIVPTSQPEELTGGGWGHRCHLCTVTCRDPHPCPTPCRRGVLSSPDELCAVGGRASEELLPPPHRCAGRGFCQSGSGLQPAAHTLWGEWWEGECCAWGGVGWQHWLAVTVCSLSCALQLRDTTAVVVGSHFWCMKMAATKMLTSVSTITGS